MCPPQQDRVGQEFAREPHLRHVRRERQHQFDPVIRAEPEAEATDTHVAAADLQRPGRHEMPGLVLQVALQLPFPERAINAPIDRGVGFRRFAPDKMTGPEWVGRFHYVMFTMGCGPVNWHFQQGLRQDSEPSRIRTHGNRGS